MHAKKIMVPTDFSHSSDAALAYATILARQTGGTLLIVHAEEPAKVYGGGELYDGELQRMLDEILPTDPVVPCEHRLLSRSGSFATRILRFAKKEKVDLIVMGTHGRTGIKRLLMGSVAEAVVRGAPCPVLILKQSDDPRRLSHHSAPTRWPERQKVKERLTASTT